MDITFQTSQAGSLWSTCLVCRRLVEVQQENPNPLITRTIPGYFMFTMFVRFPLFNNKSDSNFPTLKKKTKQNVKSTSQIFILHCVLMNEGGYIWTREQWISPQTAIPSCKNVVKLGKFRERSGAGKFIITTES